MCIISQSNNTAMSQFIAITDVLTGSRHLLNTSYIRAVSPVTGEAPQYKGRTKLEMVGGEFGRTTFVTALAFDEVAAMLIPQFK